MHIVGATGVPELVGENRFVDKRTRSLFGHLCMRDMTNTDLILVAFKFDFTVTLTTLLALFAEMYPLKGSSTNYSFFSARGISIRFIPSVQFITINLSRYR